MNRNKSILTAFGIFLICGTVWGQHQSTIIPGKSWKDEDGSLLQAHGGGVIKHGDTWYFYGENKRYGYFPSPGVSCYSSRDLINWKHEGVVCPNWIQDGKSIVPNTPEKFQSETKRPVIERPKVIYNEQTGKFVMWMHLEGRVDESRPFYQVSMAGIAVSDSPTGPFEYVNSLRPIPGALHQQFSDDEALQQFNLGSTFRDMNLFKDEDGKAYVIYAAEQNYTMHIVALTDDYCSVQNPVMGKTWNRILVEEHREAPALFKYSGIYYLLSSPCKGWSPGKAELHSSEHILGPYRSRGNPLHGKDSHITFGAQSTFVLPIDQEKGHFMFMADKWERNNIAESGYVWLPFEVKENVAPSIHWIDEWDLSWFDR
ncbi:MAG TPA: glycoside hydrolase family 43 protein [Pontiella sp.]